MCCSKVNVFLLTVLNMWHCHLMVAVADADLQEIIESVKDTKCDVSRDNDGRHLVSTPFAYVKYAPSDWPWGSSAAKGEIYQLLNLLCGGWNPLVF